MTTPFSPTTIAWEGYARASRGPDFAWWCSQYLVQSVDVWAGEPLDLEQFQRDVMDEALAETDDGAPYWRSVALVLPRKNGKTQLLAAFALYCLLEYDGAPEILLAAASDNQAGRLFDAAVGFVRQNPALGALVVVRDYVGQIARADGGGTIHRMSSDPKVLHGYNPSLVVCDEVAQWITPMLRKAWGALITAGGARRVTRVFTISTAGEAFHRSDGILGRLIDTNERDGVLERPHDALTISRNHDARTLVFNYSAPTTTPTDIDAIKLANPASWVTAEYLQRQALNPELDLASFMQLHACVWADADATWIALDDWRAAAAPHRHLVPGEAVCLGFAGKRYTDGTALVGCTLQDGHLFVLGLWEAPTGAVQWEVPFGVVDRAVAEAMDTYRVLRFYADPPLWISDIDGWARDFGSPPVVSWPSNRAPKMHTASERLELDVRAKRLTHDGNARLAAHVSHARRQVNRYGYSLSKPSRTATEPIDAAVAAILAYEARADAVNAGDGAQRSRVPVSL